MGTFIFYLLIFSGIGYWIYNKILTKKAETLRAEQRARQYQERLNNYQAAFLNKDIANIVDSGKAFSRIADSVDLDRLYKEALTLIRKNPECKPYALEMGRLKYSVLREGGSPTIYDESAIQNDIIAAQ